MAFNDSFGIERELAPGERLLWKGRPQTGIKFRSQDAYGIPFGLVWCVFIIFWGYGFMSQSHQGDGIGFALGAVMLILFSLVGFHMLIGRFLADAYMRSKMECALTDRRALIVSNAFSRKVRSIDYRSEPNISLSERYDGSGTIYFGEQFQGKQLQGNYALISSANVSGFDMIDDAREVYQRILKAKESAPR